MAKKLLMAVLFAVGISSLIACSSDDGNGNNNQEKETKGVFEVCFDPFDPLIANIYTQNGDTIYAMGEKDDDGNAIGISNVIIKLKDKENATEFYFNDSHKLKEVIADNGVRMLFEWITEKSAALTLIEPNTGEQLNTVVNLDDVNEPTVSQSRQTSSTQTCRKGNATMTLEPLKPNANALKTTRADIVGPNNRIGNVYLKNCEVPVDEKCWIKVYDYSYDYYDHRGKWRTSLPCYRVSTGHYQYVIPNTLEHVHRKTLEKDVNTVRDLLVAACEGMGGLSLSDCQTICASISASLATGIVSIPAAGVFEAACAVLSTYCMALGTDSDLGAAAIADMALGEVSYIWDTPFYLIPVVHCLPNDVVGVGQICESGNLPRDFDVSWGGKPEIGNFELEPSAPVAGQSYNAIASLGCLV